MAAIIHDNRMHAERAFYCFIHKTAFAATALAVSSHVPYNRHRRLEK